MAYSADTFVADEQPTTAKWNKLWSNDASFNDGTGIGDNAILNRHVSADNLYASKVYNPYKFKAYRTSAQTPGAATFTKVQNNVEAYDTGSNYDNATNYRFAAPVAGFYQFWARSSITGAAGGRYVQCLYKNGTIYSRGDDTSHASNPIGGPVVDLIQLSASDYVEYYVYSQNATAMEATSDICMFGGYMQSST